MNDIFSMLSLVGPYVRTGTVRYQVHVPNDTVKIGTYYKSYVSYGTVEYLQVRT